VPGGVLLGYFPNKLGMLSPCDKEVKTPSPNPGRVPKNVLRYLIKEMDTKSFQEGVFISMPAVAQ
jgi:hypothetical protein